MKICVIYGTERKGCTWHIAQEVLGYFPEAEITEYFLPRDCPDYCISCFRCFHEENHCYQSKDAQKIQESMLHSDVIMLTSPVYALHVSGAMKSFLDHYANMWMVHKPNAEMFHKKAVVIAAASGPVYRPALKEMKDSLDFWGVARTYSLGTELMEIRWENISSRLRKKIARKAERTAKKLREGTGTPGIRTRFIFYGMRFAQKHIWKDSPDAAWWQAHGWLGQARPWRQKGAS